MANEKRFRDPISKNSPKKMDLDSFINGPEQAEDQQWHEALENVDKTKSSEKPVHINLNEYYRAWGTKLAELDPQYANRKHLCQVLIAEGMNKLIEKTLREQKKKTE
ncbi:hypothetical protein PL84_02575 [Vibrio anguillarum]|uniref:hypothetical protein n=1 Tax=Vibrio anguillarum TaxID=55601 RepID=UPI00097E29EA|nr:hypothetical protein [Vibrio anguillarum]MBT2909462.1 hypothetical protein [Vibrio anguillarum]MBT2942512.1 hypothetical protein [Vibrio anguillarum]MBT2950664.1 hypothetical protein [Vibrio anguillarum]MBT2979577.1 hypothetical protein [Vibrio anguillarum]